MFQIRHDSVKANHAARIITNRRNAFVRCFGASRGFTLLELLVVMAIIALALGAVLVTYRSPSQGAEVKAAAFVMASRLRDLRAAAMMTHSEQVAKINVANRTVRFSDGRAPLTLKRSIAVSVTAAESEQNSPSDAGVRFFPNGSSSGAVIALRSNSQGYEIRINWLTGRVSTNALR